MFRARPGIGESRLDRAPWAIMLGADSEDRGSRIEEQGTDTVSDVEFSALHTGARCEGDHKADKSSHLSLNTLALGPPTTTLGTVKHERHRDP